MCTERYIDPFTDFGFKLLFGTPANKEFLIAILNALLDGEEVVTDISYNNTEVFGKTPDDRKAVYDLYCETSDGSHIIVECQNAYQRFFLDRTVYYSSFPMQAVAKKGEWNYKLPKIYTISFLNFVMSEYADDPHYKHVVRLCDTRTGKVFFDKLTFIYLEMPKFNKGVEELNGYADWWLYIIRNMVRLNEMPTELRDKIFVKFFKTAEIAKFTPEQRMAYEVSLKNMRDYNNTIVSAEEKGFDRGIQQGIAEGREEGRAEGREEGMAEGIRKMARKMLEAGIPNDTIMSTTGLSASEINEIASEK